MCWQLAADNNKHAVNEYRKILMIDVINNSYELIEDCIETKCVQICCSCGDPVTDL